MFRRAQQGKATLIRFNEREALTIFPPPFDQGGQWHEVSNGVAGKQHTLADLERALGGEATMVIQP